uniref:Uncharacterized protein n=1 Tax=Cacopsylla melanoneura TaxID=428564 RepID=A0A8D9ALW6_9HEMI
MLSENGDRGNPSNADLMAAITASQTAVSAQIEELKATINEDREKVESKNADFEKRLKAHDRKFEITYKKEARKNIVIYGWEEAMNNPLHIIRDKFVSLLSDKLLVKDVRIFDIHDIRIAGSKKNVVIVTLCSPHLARMILSNAFKLKGSKIFLDFDRSPEERATRTKLLTHKKRLADQGKGNIKLKDNTLIVDGEALSLEQLDATMGEECENTTNSNLAEAEKAPETISTNNDFEMGKDIKKRSPPKQDFTQQSKKVILETPKLSLPPNFPMGTFPIKKT